MTTTNDTANDTATPRAGWCVTCTGREITVRDPEPHYITAGMVAHSLAQINRYAGHASRPISVAEHSLLVMEITQRELIASDTPRAAIALLALLHDAEECITGDITSPVKDELHGMHRPLARAAERACLQALMPRTLAKLKADGNLDYARNVVHAADLIALATERAHLLPRTPTPWEIDVAGIRPVTWAQLSDPSRYELTWTDWRDAWLHHYEGLAFALEGPAHT